MKSDQFYLFSYIRRLLGLTMLNLAVALTSFSQDSSPLTKSYKEFISHKEQSQYHLNWISIGPVMNSARAESIQVHPSDPNTIYAAFGSGGLWKSTNNGLTWNSIFENVPSQGIGDIAIAPSDPDILYVGTGESLKKPRNFTMPGTGVYKSLDGGKTWMHLGLENVWHISEVVVHPDNPDLVLVAAMGKFWSRDENRGIYRTENGGKTWEKVLYIDDKTSGNDLVFAPSNPDIVYASLWENDPNYSMHLATDSKGLGGLNSSVYKSSDSGKTWEKVNSGLPNDESTGRIGLAVSYQKEDKVYAFIDHRNKPAGEGAGELYKTTDGGQSWTKTHNGGLQNLSVIGWYFMDSYVNPEDDEEVYLLGVRMLRTSDGGESFENISGTVHHHFPSQAQTLHLDHCELWINPENPNHLVLGNDGGVYISTDKGLNWRHSNNIPSGEFYDIALSSESPYRIYGGTQDDATVFGYASEWNPEYADEWNYLFIDAWSGGDGCISHVDPNDPNTVYFSMQHAAVRRKDLAKNTSVSIRPDLRGEQTGNLKSNFITPYILSPHDSKILYLAGNYVFKSTNRGDDWQLISEDLSQSGDDERISMAAGAIAESPVSEGLLYVGTDRGAFWSSMDGGQSWKERSKGLPVAYIRSIRPSAHSENRVYLAATGINYDDLGAHLYVSENNGKKWKSIRSNLPNEVVNVIYEDPENENILFAGTLRGVYVSKDRGDNWSLFGMGLPAVAVADIEIEPVTKDMVIATHGKGIYKVNLKPFYETLSSTEGYIQIENAHLPLRVDSHRDYLRKSAEKSTISWWSDFVGETKLEIFDEGDSLVWQTKLNSRSGLNQFRWDLVVKRHDNLLPYFVEYEQYIEPGEYRLKLYLNGITREKKFKILE